MRRRRTQGAMKWRENVERLNHLLAAVEFTSSGTTIDTEEAFELWAEWTSQVRQSRKTIYLIGNGASASMASHFAADLAKNGHLHTQVFSDVCLLTAVSNDISFESVYSEPLRRRGRTGDLLVAISSSGSSRNILNCAELANKMEISVVTVTGFSADNPLRSLGDLNAYVPATSYGDAETAHAAILHCWMDLVELGVPAPSERKQSC